MKLSDIILREGVQKRMVNFLDDLHRNKQTISVAAFMKEFGVDKQEAIDFIHRWNISKVDRSVMEEKNCGCGETPCKTYGITEENRYNEDGYDEGDIKLMGDMILPTGKMVVLQAEEDTYNRGLLVTSNEDKSYDVAYWADDKTKPYPIGIEIDGKEVAKDAKIIKFLFHPEMKEEKGEFKKRDKNESISLSEPSVEMEKVIDSGIRISGDMNNIKDVMYYVHNNWMGGDFSAEEAMKKISKYIS